MKIAYLYDPRAPFDGARPDMAELHALGGDVLDFSREHDLSKYAAVVNLHGGYFPKDNFEGIYAALCRGAGLVCLGGLTPFSLPVRADGTAEAANNSYHQRLNIHHALTMKKERFATLAANADLPLLSCEEGRFAIADTLALMMRFTKTRDVPTDDGCAGPIDGAMLPLLSGYGDGSDACLDAGQAPRPMAAPAALVEYYKGEFAGGRWVFVNQALTPKFWANGGADVLKKLAVYAGGGVVELRNQPGYASYFPGEQPAFHLRMQRLAGKAKPAELSIEVAKDDKRLWSVQLGAETAQASLYRVLPTDLRAEPGLYETVTTLRVEGEPDRVLRNGFWGYDQALLSSGEELVCGRDYFQMGGKPQPIVGMTYMQSDIHRKFLDLPNPHIWDCDMAEMARAGINMIRTGIWTGHRNAAFIDGLVREDHMRAFDAFAMTAKKHGIPVVFNFFAFTPEAWEGVNSYLDPRSVQAQKRYIASFVSRHAQSKGVSWDLINEPSLMTLHTGWGARVNGDAFELAAWRAFLAKRHGDIAALQERWRVSAGEMPSFEAATLPQPEDFISGVNYTAPQKAMKVHDYLLFQQYVHNQWARQLVGAVRDSGSAAPVTVGQDEGLNAYRPSPLFYQEAVDYTTCHSWWLNDDLYWDGLFSKDLEKPCLIQETGIMFVQTAASDARRTQDELRDLLERKYALALAAGNAGAVHWLWNVNVHMDSFNEINIGAITADGSHKLEADVSYGYGAFVRKAGHLFRGRKVPQVAVVFPYANNFSVRDGAIIATKHAARVLGYDLRVQAQAYGEYHLNKLPEGGLILLPCARSLSDQAWETLMARVRNGATLLLTGPFSYDAYFRRVEGRSAALGVETRLCPIAREETLYVDGAPYRASFPGTMFEWVDTERPVGAKRDELTHLRVGKGNVLFSPLPVELCPNDEAVRAVYKKAVEVAGIKPPFALTEGGEPGLLAAKLEMEAGACWVLVSERAADADIALRDAATGKTYRLTVPGGRAALFATDADGRVVASYMDRFIEVA